MNILLTGVLFFAVSAHAEDVVEVQAPDFSTAKDFSEAKPKKTQPESQSSDTLSTAAEGTSIPVSAPGVDGTAKAPSLFEDGGSESNEAGVASEEVVAGDDAKKNIAEEEVKEEAANEEVAEQSSGQKLFARAKCESLPQRTPSELWVVAECFKEQNDYTQSIASLQELVRKDPQDLEAVFVLAWLIWEEGRRIGGRKETKNTKRAVAELMKARNNNPTHWLLDVEIGDFYFLRMNAPDLAYAEYIKARKHAKGDFSRSVPKAKLGRKVSIENRIARTSEVIGRKGEAVEASCNALYMDPDDPEAAKRIRDLSGSCERKGVENPLLRVPASEEPQELD